MEHPAPSLDALIRPWRTATLVASAVAAGELVLLVVAGIAVLGRPVSHHVRKAAEAHVLSSLGPAAAPPKRRAPPAVARLPRRKTRVLVLNGNGRTGAAASEAARVRSHGYVVRGVGNARRTDYTRTIVMYRAGFRGEGARLARDLRVKVFAPLDGLKPRDLHGARLVLVVGD